MIGLLFLAMSINLDLLHAEQNADLMRQARQSFGNLLYLLAIALVFLVPFDAPVGLCAALLALSVGGLGSTIRAIVLALREGRTLVQLVSEAGLSLLAHGALLVVAVMLLSGNTGSLYGLVVVVAAMLVRPSRNAWNFLLRAGETLKHSRRK